MVEARETRLKRLAMRSSRRGIKEMDLVLGSFAAERLAAMPDAALDAWEALLDENDQDILSWLLGQSPVPPRHAPLMAEIAAHAGDRWR